jgi:hypothetical protein
MDIVEGMDIVNKAKNIGGGYMYNGVQGIFDINKSCDLSLTG